MLMILRLMSDQATLNGTAVFRFRVCTPPSSEIFHVAWICECNEGGRSRVPKTRDTTLAIQLPRDIDQE